MTSNEQRPGIQPVLPLALQGSEEVVSFLDLYAQKYAQILSRRPELEPEDSQQQAHCPCCGGIFARFELFRHKPEHPWRHNAQCPVCGSLERHRRLWLQLCEEDALWKEGALLHFAPEAFLRGMFTAWGRHEYVDCDLQAERAGRSVDITELPFSGGAFDWCICSHVLEHVDDDSAALAELARVLKPGAVAWLLVPTLKQGTLVHEPPSGGFTPNDHRREYGLEDFVQRCSQAGLEAEVLHARAIDPQLKARHVLSNHIYRCRRR